MNNEVPKANKEVGIDGLYIDGYTNTLEKVDFKEITEII